MNLLTETDRDWGKGTKIATNAALCGKQGHGETALHEVQEESDVLVEKPAAAVQSMGGAVGTLTGRRCSCSRVTPTYNSVEYLVDIMVDAGAGRAVSIP